jgi:hypothetical protein
MPGLQTTVVGFAAALGLKVEGGNRGASGGGQDFLDSKIAQFKVDSSFPNSLTFVWSL